MTATIYICSVLLAVVLTTVAVRKSDEKRLRYWKRRCASFESVLNQDRCVRRIS